MRRRSSVAGISRSRGESQWRNLRLSFSDVCTSVNTFSPMFHTAIRHAHTTLGRLPLPRSRGAEPARPATGRRAIEFPCLWIAITEAVASISLREAPWWVSSGVTWCDAAHVVKLCMQTFIHLFRCNQGGNG